jgi:lipopolysaccharide transport system ATP-binding protein
MSIPAIKVEGLWKRYTVGAAAQRHATFYDMLAASAAAPFRRLRHGRSTAKANEFWALSDVSFEVQPGEVLGIVGRNGAGKSTLLKVLSRITAPTRGRVSVRGRLASLLEVGTGFHPELSGRENIYLNGAILGMKRREIDRKFDEIVEFAEVSKFIDTPVKRYSSGMYVRLAFGVAANLDSDVLVVDEVLAVGDTAFQEKCMAKMDGLSGGGRTVLFVSHNLGAVSRLCTRCVVLSSGQVHHVGGVAESLLQYSRLSQVGGQDLGQSTGSLAEQVKLTSIKVNGDSQLVGNVTKPEDQVELTLSGRVLSPLNDFRVRFDINKDGQRVVALHDLELPADIDACAFECVVKVPAFLLSPGDYSVDVCAYTNRPGEWLMAKGVGQFAVSPEWYPLYEPGGGMGLVNLKQAGARKVWS